MVIKSLTIQGFKSVRELNNLQLRGLNVLIGANGAGKSNFVVFFKLLREMVEQRLQVSLATEEGGADGCLYLGPKVTKEFSAKIYFGRNGYEFSLVPTSDNRLIFTDETTVFEGDFITERLSLGSGQLEAKLKEDKDKPGKGRTGYSVAQDVYSAISSWVVYHFHDTSLSASVRRARAINDNQLLRSNADNLAPFLYRIQRTNPDSYLNIRDVVRLATPFFDDFNLRPMPTNTQMIQLEWRQTDSDYPFRANQLSDGTLRFICLATALLQPSPPSTFLFDEPELGLHPYALALLGSLFQQVAQDPHRQIIISTQSVQLLSEFVPEDVIVVERTDGESTFRRLDSSQLSEWLEEYTLGELWQKNIIGGRPHPEPVSRNGVFYSS